MKILTASLIAFALGVVLTFVVRAVARRYRIVAPPRPDRWHNRPTAMLGGGAIYVAFMAAYALFPISSDPRLGAILLGATAIFLLGLIDDTRGLKPFVRLVVHIAVAGLVVNAGVQLHWIGPAPVHVVISIFWLVGITNAINLLDNMDGLAAGITVISTVFLGTTFALNGQPELATVAAALGGAVAGFLIFNFHPASIFMGDCGATFLGFVLGAVSLLSTTGRSRSLAVVLLGPVLILLIPIFDTTLVTITRKLSGLPASQGGRDHASHRLVALGLSETRAVVTLYGLAIASGGLALWLRLVRTESLFFLVPLFAVGFVLLGVYLGRIRIFTRPSDAPSAHTTLDALTHFSHKRRVFEIALDVVLISLAYFGAYWLRFEDALPGEQRQILITTLPLIIVFQMLALLATGVYSGLWRYASLPDLVRIWWGAAGGVAASALVVFAARKFIGPSRAVFVLDFLMLVLLVGGSRVSFRLIPRLLKVNNGTPTGEVKVVIYGAGDGGEILIRELLNNPSYGYAPVGFIDDDDYKVGRQIQGFPIYPRSRLAELKRTHDIREILVSSSKVPEDTIEHLRSMGFLPRRLRIHFE